MTPLRLGLMIADGVSAAVVFLIASIARFGDGRWVQIWSDLGLDIRIVAVFFAIAWVAVLWYRGMYQLRTRWRLQSEALDILRATIHRLRVRWHLWIEERDIARTTFLLLVLTLRRCSSSARTA
jgi:hypothetical protein